MNIWTLLSLTILAILNQTLFTLVQNISDISDEYSKCIIGIPYSIDYYFYLQLAIIQIAHDRFKMRTVVSFIKL